MALLFILDDEVVKLSPARLIHQRMEDEEAQKLFLRNVAMAGFHLRLFCDGPRRGEFTSCKIRPKLIVQRSSQGITSSGGFSCRQPKGIALDGLLHRSHCYDTVSLSQKLSLHRHAKVHIVHVFLWDPATADLFSSPPRSSSGGIHLLFINETLDSMEFPRLGAVLPPQQVGGQVMPLADEDEDAFRFERENAGNASFKFQEIPFTNESFVMKTMLYLDFGVGSYILGGYVLIRACK